jgi:hypothetical protein
MEIPELGVPRAILKIKNKDFEYELEITEKGFTLWVHEDKGLHWLIDASTLKETNDFLLTRGKTWEIGLKEVGLKGKDRKYNKYVRRFKVVKRKSKN